MHENTTIFTQENTLEIPFDDVIMRFVLFCFVQVLAVVTYDEDVVRLFEELDNMGYDFTYHLLLTLQTQVHVLRPWWNRIHGSIQYQLKEPENPDLWYVQPSLT